MTINLSELRRLAEKATPGPWNGMKWMVEVVHPAIVEREGFADEVREKYAHLIGDEPWGNHGTT